MGPNTHRLLELIRAYRLDDRHEHVRRLRVLYEQELLPDDIAAVHLQQIQPLADEQERRPNYLHRAPTREELYPDGEPDLVIGRLAENEEIPIGLFLSGPCHVIFAGRTGFGKTTAIRALIIAVAKYNHAHPQTPICVIILDRKGQDYGDIPAMYPDQYLHFDIHSTLRLGLNAPVGFPVDTWINNEATIFCARAGLKFAWVSFANMIRWALEQMNRQPSYQLHWPDFQLLLDLATAAPPTLFASKSDYAMSLIQALEGVTQASGPVFRTFNGLDLERDVISQGKSAVLSMPNMAPAWLRQYIGDLLMLQILPPRIHRAHRPDRIEVIVIVDEADTDVSREAELAFADGMSPISQGLRQGREFGVSDCLGVGQIGTVSRHILDAVSYHFFFSLGHAESIIEAKRTLLLPHRGEELLPALDKGECVVRLPGTWPHAMLAKINYVPPNRTVPGHYDSHPFIPSVRLADLPELRAALESKILEHERSRPRKTTRKDAGLSPTARKLLYLASLRPYRPVARLYEGKQPSYDALARMRKELEDAGYATFAEPRVGRRTLLLIEILETGWSTLGAPPVPLKGRGGIAHKHFANWIRGAGEGRGHQTMCEWVVPGTTHPVDVVWHVDGRAQVFEVVVECEDNLVQHLQTCLLESNTVTTVTVVAGQKKTIAELHTIICAEAALSPVLNRIEYQVIDDYLKEFLAS